MPMTECENVQRSPKERVPFSLKARRSLLGAVPPLLGSLDFDASLALATGCAGLEALRRLAISTSSGLVAVRV